jgi:PadR family transcriptional regulator
VVERAGKPGAIFSTIWKIDFANFFPISEETQGKGRVTIMDKEQVVMLAIMRKHPNAYGVSIYEELAERLQKEVAMATIYATLEKLEDKGFIKCRRGEATAERGGRAKMFYELTGKGQAALNVSLSALGRLLAGTKMAGAMAT